MIDWLIARAKRTPYMHINDYMRRWWLVPYKHERRVTWRQPIAWILQRFDIAIRVHEILRSDDARAFHDHPWPYLTIILRGGYWEVRPVFESGMYIGATRVWHGPGSILFRRASTWHRLEVQPGQIATTLFVTGPKRQSWGFLTTPNFKTYYRDYK